MTLEPLQPIQVCIYRQPADRLWGELAFLTSPIFQPPGSSFRGQALYPEVAWFSSQYGKVGSVRVVPENDRSARLEYMIVPLPSAQEVIPYESEIRSLLRQTPYMLSDLVCSVEESRRRYTGMLFDVRLELLRQVRFWLIDHLRIFGVDSLYPDFTEFVFPIQGTPAQFGVLAREITSRSKFPGDQKIECQVRNPGRLFDFGSLPSDANPIEVRLTVEKARLEIRASGLSDGTTLLRFSNLTCHRAWDIWSLLREEMERLQVFHLPVVPDISPATLDNKEESLPIQLTDTAVSKLWLQIPDVGSSREIVRLWHENLTCKEIAVRLGCTEKTIINRINLLRNQYGKEIVPYRRATAKNSPT